LRTAKFLDLDQKIQWRFLLVATDRRQLHIDEQTPKTLAARLGRADARATSHSTARFKRNL
jgi:hypothetical protein